MATIIPGKLIYLAHPRTASSAMAVTLQEIPNAKPRFGHHDTIEKIRERVHWLKDEVTVTTIRNPYDLLTSWWCVRPTADWMDMHGRIHKQPWPTFDLFICKFDTPYFRFRDPMFYHLPTDRVLRFEYLQDDFDKLCVEFDLPIKQILPHNVTPNKQPWVTYYQECPAAIQAAQDRFGDEIERLNYGNFNGALEWKPSLCD